MAATRRIVIVLYPGTELLDATGPASVFANANGGMKPAKYEVVVVAARAGAMATSSGVSLVATHSLHFRGPIDTLLVPGGEGTREAVGDAGLVAGIARLASRARRVASVCSGAFLLAQAGLLDGRRATTHWKYLASLRRAYPRVQVDDDAIFVQDGRYWTSAGVTAGLDLALALVEADHGRQHALAVARGLVFYLKRPGGQSQFSVPLAAQAADAPAIERIRQHVLDSPHADLRVSVLAERAHVSERHLRRLFRDALGVAPREFVQRVRLEQAQRLLCESRASVREVARRAGYASADGFARRFEAAFRVSPRAYRARFHREDS